jgi:aminodeoxyfutalosine synthase
MNSESIISGSYATCRTRLVVSPDLFPFAFEPETTVLSHIPRATAVEQLRNLAVSRIYLDNIDHLTAYWVSLDCHYRRSRWPNYGVDDLHGTIMREKIFHMAGAKTPEEQTVETLEHAIRQAGRIPVPAR